MNEILKDAIHHQRITLAEMLSAPLAELANRCANVWGTREKMDSILSDGFRSVPYCLFLYALDPDGIQISDNVSIGGLLPVRGWTWPRSPWSPSAAGRSRD